MKVRKKNNTFSSHKNGERKTTISKEHAKDRSQHLPRLQTPVKRKVSLSWHGLCLHGLKTSMETNNFAQNLVKRTNDHHLYIGPFPRRSC